MRARSIQRVEIACPHCARTQWESGRAVSTFCRNCGGHFDIIGGKAVDRPDPEVLHRLHTKSADPEATRENGIPAGDNGLAFSSNSAEEELRASSAAPARSSRTSASLPGNGFGMRTPGQRFQPFRSAKPLRTQSVQCFECGHTHEASRSATSMVCPSCNAYVSLRDVDVKNLSRQKIRTRGDVVVHKRACLHGSSLECHNLVVLGRITGSVACTGNASVYSDCEIRGSFSCRKLIVHSKANVRFLRPVHALEMEIHGHLSGDFYCSSKVKIGRNGAIRGELLAKSLSVDPGGAIDGNLRVCSDETQADREFRVARDAQELEGDHSLVALPFEDPGP